MKKKYIKPEIKVRKINPPKIMSGSVNLNDCHCGCQKSGIADGSCHCGDKNYGCPGCGYYGGNGAKSDIFLDLDE